MNLRRWTFLVPVNIFHRFITVDVVVKTYFCYCAMYAYLLNAPDGPLCGDVKSFPLASLLYSACVESNIPIY